MTAKEAMVIIECELTNMTGEYADMEMPETIKRIYDALTVAEEALEKQIPKKSKIGISKPMCRMEAWDCANCGGEVNDRLDNYCRWCGHAIE